MPMTVRVNPRIRTLDELAQLDEAAIRAAVKAADEAFRAEMRTVFDSEGSVSGPRWQELSPEYRKRKDRWFGKAKADFKRRMADMAQLPAHYQTTVPKGFGRDLILELTGELRRSFTQEGGDHIAESFNDGDALVIRLGSRNEKAVFHAEGGPHLPVRMPLRLRYDQRQRIRNAALEALKAWRARNIRAFARAAGMGVDLRGIRMDGPSGSTP